MSRSARYEIIFKPDGGYYLKDIGPWDKHLTITNDAENVVAKTIEALGPCQHIEYEDSEGERGYLLVKDGKFVGFAHFAPQ